MSSFRDHKCHWNFSKENGGDSGGATRSWQHYCLRQGHGWSIVESIGSVDLKLNTEKCKLRQTELPFLRQVINKVGVWPDPVKVSAINKLSPLQNVQELRRALGMINYLGRYIPDLATVGQPLYELLKSKSAWMWSPAQQVTSPTLVSYDAKRSTVVSADASSYGIGGVLLQLHGEDWRPVVFCSTWLSDAETRYTQIEKECLAPVWACERFEKYLYSLPAFKLITDHTPLMNFRDLTNTPVRCQTPHAADEVRPGSCVCTRKDTGVADMLSSLQQGIECSSVMLLL